MEVVGNNCAVYDEVTRMIMNLCRSPNLARLRYASGKSQHGTGAAV